MTSLSALAVLLVLAPFAASAADCNQQAMPGVDWQRCYMDGRDLSRHTLTGARLRETSFQRARLDGADLTQADGYRARFVSAALKGCRLAEARLSEADFTRADLAGADLTGADLRRARFFNASLRGADLSGAKTQGAEFLNADLSGARWTDGRTVCAEGSLGQCN